MKVDSLEIVTLNMIIFFAIDMNFLVTSFNRINSYICYHLLEIKNQVISSQP